MKHKYVEKYASSSSSVEGNVWDECGNAVKLAIVQDYNRHMGYTDKSDHMTNNWFINRQTWKWAKKFFHLLDLSLLNSFILFTFCGSELSYQTCLVQVHNIKGGKGAWTTDHHMGKTNSFHHLTDPTWHTTWWTLAVRRKTSSALHKFHKKTKKVGQNTNVQNAMDCVLTPASGFTIQNYNYCYYTIILQIIFNWWNELAERVQIYERDDKLTLFRSIFRYFLLILMFCGTKKNGCLERTMNISAGLQTSEGF
jgi:hypothetical protein